MTDEQINIAIAESLGWTNCRLAIKGAGGGTRYLTAHGIPPNRKYEASCPNYTSDLNAMHEAEKVLTEIQCAFYRQNLREITTEMPASIYVWHATARQRAGAYLRTIGKWIE